MRRLAPAATAASKTLREPVRLISRLSPPPATMTKARWTTTSASSTSPSTASRSSTSPRRYSVFSQPCPARSKGRRAIPITRSTSGSRSSAEIKALPISPVGPVTATVSTRRSLSSPQGRGEPGRSLRGLQKATGEPIGQPAGTCRREHPEERAPGGDPGERALEHRDAQAVTDKAGEGKRRQCAIMLQVGAKQHAAGADRRRGKHRLEQLRWQLDDGDRVADEKQRRRQALRPALVIGQDEVTDLATRSRRGLWHVDGESLLQLSGADRGDKRGSRCSPT